MGRVLNFYTLYANIGWEANNNNLLDFTFVGGIEFWERICQNFGGTVLVQDLDKRRLLGIALADKFQWFS